MEETDKAEEMQKSHQCPYKAAPRQVPRTGLLSVHTVGFSSHHTVKAALWPWHGT